APLLRELMAKNRYLPHRLRRIRHPAKMTERDLCAGESDSLTVEAPKLLNDCLVLPSVELGELRVLSDRIPEQQLKVCHFESVNSGAGGQSPVVEPLDERVEL